MSVQDAPKAVSTITRDAIEKAAPGATYAQMIQSIPGVLSITDDVTGLNDAGTARDACANAGVSAGELPGYRAALATLATSQMIRVRAATEAAGKTTERDM